MKDPRILISSFHDLAPHSRPACEFFLDMLGAMGVGRAVLLVVPRWHGSRDIAEDRDFVLWLQAKAAEGHEVCLHGWEHRAERIRPDPISQAIGRLYTAGEGEFHALDRAGALEKINAGLAVLRRAGFAPRGFVAPAWLLSRPSLEVLRNLGFEHTTTLTRIHLLQTNRALFAPAIALSSRSAWRRHMSCLYLALAAAMTRRCPVLRIAAHPGDFVHPQTRRALEALIRAAARDRIALTYDDVAQARMRAAEVLVAS